MRQMGFDYWAIYKRFGSKNQLKKKQGSSGHFGNGSFVWSVVVRYSPSPGRITSFLIMPQIGFKGAYLKYVCKFFLHFWTPFPHVHTTVCLQNSLFWIDQFSDPLPRSVRTYLMEASPTKLAGNAHWSMCGLRAPQCAKAATVPSAARSMR